MIRRPPNKILTPFAIPYTECPAKTYSSSNGVTKGRTVFNHCQIVGEVAREIIRRFPTAAQRLFPAEAPFAAANHDVGKVSPTFYNKLMRACGHELLPGFNPDLEKNWGGHAGVSQLTATALGAPEFVPDILGQHHGFSPSLAGKRALDEIFGGELWQQERIKLIAALEEHFRLTWPEITSAAQARLIAGLTSVADWIGSGEFFEDPEKPWQDNIGKALDAAGFVTPTYQTGLSFEQVFGFPPRKAQTSLLEQITSPGVYVLEAPMGLGKTEAALFAAYNMRVEAYVSCDRYGKAMPRLPLMRDFHMVGSGYDDQDPWQNLLIPKTSEGKKPNGAGSKMTYRYYLQDMAFAVALQGPQQELQAVAKALQNPIWDLYLGRKNCVPTEFIFQGIHADAETALQKARRLAESKKRLPSFNVLQGEHEGEVLTLNDVPLQFGEHKQYRDRRVTVLKLE